MSKCIGGVVNDSLGDLLAYSPGKSFGNRAERSIRLLLLLLLYSLLNFIPLSAETRFLWDGDVPLHEWTYPLSQRPDTVDDSEGWRSYQTPEPQTELTTWIFDEGTFVPSAKLVGDRRYSIISDYLGTPVEAYDEGGRRVWQRELDIYGRTRVERGEVGLVPFLYQGQYLDTETGPAYNRFRYYSPETGAYISQDPIRLEAGLTNLYAYVYDTNAWVDVLGLSQQIPLAKPGEDLFVGTYNQVRGGNMKTGLNSSHTPHHTVQNAISPTTHGRGITINLRKDLHELTRTYKVPVDKSILSLRDHLAADITDLKRILLDAGYDPQVINRQLSELIRQNKELGGFDKPSPHLPNVDSH